MVRKLAGVLALATALAFGSTALAQDGSTSITDLTTFITTVLGPLAAVIWFVLFARWGGFRYLI
jgi:uncharacterized membrane protein YccF (DUF307 family)